MTHTTDPFGPLKLKNAIQPYAWGSRTALAELLGRRQPSPEPQAELWMGAHPKAPSMVWVNDDWYPLDRLVARHPVPLLGRAVVDRFGPHFPFLLKVLAVDQPLSIQAHPSRRMAVKGFARENAQGIPLDSPLRNYRDDRHKPECVCALTSFWALCGFRSPKTIRDFLDPVWPASRRRELDAVDGNALSGTRSWVATGTGSRVGYDSGLETFFAHVMTATPAAIRDLVAQVAAAAQSLRRQDPVYDWMVRLSETYPADVGVLSPALLHLIQLTPGEALFLPSGCLHAYLHGTAIEVMANSDNVLRGGLTPKHVDVAELLKVLDFRHSAVSVLDAGTVGPLERSYPSQADEFVLSIVDIPRHQPYSCAERTSGPEILFCTRGSAAILDEKGEVPEVVMARGEAVLVPACVGGYTIQGSARIFKASVNGSRFERGTASLP